MQHVHEQKRLLQQQQQQDRLPPIDETDTMDTLDADVTAEAVAAATSSGPTAAPPSGDPSVADAVVRDIPASLPLAATWTLYHHLHTSKNWTLSGYDVVFAGMDTVDKVISIAEKLPDSAIKTSMWFLMRGGISPMWEDPLNNCGGNFSYKVTNKFVPEVWKTMVYMLCGGSLVIDRRHNALINGITSSPKKNFCILKIWLNTTAVQDTKIIAEIPNLTMNGSVFKKHGT